MKDDGTKKTATNIDARDKWMTDDDCVCDRRRTTMSNRMVSRREHLLKWPSFLTNYPWKNYLPTEFIRTFVKLSDQLIHSY